MMLWYRTHQRPNQALSLGSLDDSRAMEKEPEAIGRNGYEMLGRFEPSDAKRVLKRFAQDGIRFAKTNQYKYASRSTRSSGHSHSRRTVEYERNRMIHTTPSPEVGDSQFRAALP